MATYTLSHELIGEHLGGVLCLDFGAVGRSYRLHAARPGAKMNRRLGPVAAPAQAEASKVVRVDICGALEQRAGHHSACGGWSDGHDTVAERMIAGLEVGDVVMVIDSPGGAAAGLAEAVRRVAASKEAHGRRVYAYADELIGSAAYWWACVADEIYLPALGAVGSVGARASHASVAGALEQAGVEVTYFAWPPGKASLAPELPLTDEARRRGIRDIETVGQAFAEAVASARGLSVDDVVGLDADCLIGEAAVGAGLADAVASLEDVIDHAIAIAEEGMTTEEHQKIRTLARELGLTGAIVSHFGVSPYATVAAAERKIVGAVGKDAWRAAKAAGSPVAAATVLARAKRASDPDSPEDDEPKRTKKKRARRAEDEEARRAHRVKRRLDDEIEDDEDDDDEDDEDDVTPDDAEPEPDYDAEPEPEPDPEDEEALEREERARRARAKKKRARRAKAEACADRILARQGVTPASPGYAEARAKYVAGYLSAFARRRRPAPPKAPPPPPQPRVTRAMVEAAKRRPAVIAAAARSGKDLDTYARAYVASFPAQFGAV